MLKDNECNEKDLADLAIGKKSVYFEKTICDMARIFTAIKLSDDFKQSLGELQNELRNRGVGGYYAQYQNLHLTLTFIGNIPEEQLVSVQKAVSEVKFEPFEICTDHMGFFNNDEAKVLWMGLDKNDILENMVTCLKERLMANGVAFQHKDFKAHITLVSKPTEFITDLNVVKKRMTVNKISVMETVVADNRVQFVER